MKPEVNQSPAPEQKKMTLRKQLVILGCVMFSILAIRSSIIEPFRIPSRSMLPGLMMGDFLFANKLVYGFHLPFTEFILGKPIYLGQRPTPIRGEVVIFTPPEAGQESLYIKRVVGLPGDRIQFFGKNLWINGSAVLKEEITGADRDGILKHRGFDPENRYDSSKLHVFKESIDGREYFVLEDSSFESRHDQQEMLIPADQYFVLGDNRDDTRDSRFFGVIPIQSIRAKAFVIWFSYRVSFGDSNWSFRPERIGKSIQ
jgi:signal peptidase I